MNDFTDLHALIDGELPSNEISRVRERLKSDPAYQAEYEAISNLKDLLSQRAVQYEAEDCWRACTGRLNELDKSKRVEGFVGRYAWAMCLIFFVAILGGHYAVKDVRGVSTRSADLAKIFSVGHVEQAPSSPGQQRLYEQLLREAKQARRGLRVDRVTQSAMLDVPVTRFDIRDSSGPLAYFVIDANVNFEDAAEVPTDPGLSTGVITTPTNSSGRVNCVIWNSGERTRVLAGSRSPQALVSLVSDLGLR